MSRLRHEHGISLLELIISGSIMSLLALVLSTFMTGRLHDYARSEAHITVQQNTKTALELLLGALRSAQAVQSVNRWPDVNGPGGPLNPYSWQTTTADPATLVLAVPAVDSSGNPLYADILHNSLQTNDVIFYINSNDQSLYRRVIANPVVGNAAKTTCPPELASALCPPDAKVIERVAGLDAIFLLNHNLTTTTPEDAASVRVTLTQELRRGGVDYRSSLTGQGTLRN